MKRRVMIASVFSNNSLKYAITKLSPDELVLVVEKGYDMRTDKDSQTKKESIIEIKKTMGEVLTIKILEVNSLYDIQAITKEIVKEIDKYSSQDYDVDINITEGRKTLSLGLMFAAYSRKDKIKGLYYVIKDIDNQVMSLPILSFPQINDIEKEILKIIEKNIINIEEIKNKTGKSRSVIYLYVRDLKQKGYLSQEEDNLILTDLAKIYLL
jgi:CRISPR locus-related DNA-binding protein